MTVKHLQGATGQRNLCVFFLVLFDIYLPTCSVHNKLYLTYFTIFNIFFSQFEVKKKKTQVEETKKGEWRPTMFKLTKR